MMFVIKSANLLDKCRKGWIEVSHMEKRLVILTKTHISDHSLNHSSSVLFLCFFLSNYTGNQQTKRFADFFSPWKYFGGVDEPWRPNSALIKGCLKIEK